MIFIYKVIIGIILLLLMINEPCFAIDLSAQSAIVMERKSYTVIYQKNAYQKLGMASTTKIMTALVALENAELDEIVTVSNNAANVEGSSMWLAPGEKIKLEDLLYGLMLNSGNDAAVAIAEHVGGSVTEFCEMMNKKAVEIGAKNTRFTNPNGLYDEDHYTTAYDLALISCYALENETFARIVKTKKKTVPWEGKGFDRLLVNHNKMLTLYEGADGIKTGFTKITGRTLVSSATKNNFQVVCVTLNAPSDWSDHKKMFNYAFTSYEAETVIPKGDYVKTVPVKNGIENKIGLRTLKDLFVFHKTGKKREYETNLIVPEELNAPVYKGDKAGVLQVLVDGKVCDSSELLIDTTILADQNEGFFKNYMKILKYWLMYYRI